MNFHKKLSIGNFAGWMCTILLILLSGCTYFTQAYRKETVGVLVTFTLVYVGVRHVRLKKRQFLAFTIISSMLFLNFTVNSMSMTTVNMLDYCLIVASVGCIAMLASGMELEDFKEKYIVVMDVIGVISLVFFYIQLTNKTLVYQLGSSNLVKGYLVNPFHTWGWTYIFGRNAGPFWEPGAFQGYLLLAILFILNGKNIQAYKKSLVILVTTVITTMSTTGYILLAIIICYFAVIYWKQSLRKSKDKILTIVKVVVVVAFTTILVAYISSSNVILNKLSSDNQSFSTRMMDLKYGLDIVRQKIFCGFGISNSVLMSALRSYGMDSNSIGLFAILQYFGALFGVLFIVWNFYKTCKIYQNLNIIIVLLIFFILHLTEALLLFPIYISFLFWNNSNHEKVNNGELL